MNDKDYNTQLIARRAALTEQYARLRHCAGILMERGAVRFDKERHEYFIRERGYWRGQPRDLMAAKKLIELQSLIKEQAMRLLELENMI